MFLHKIHLNPRCREARRDLADPYQLHSTLCRAFTTSDEKCPPGTCLWRLEPESDRRTGHPIILVQSRILPDWAGLGVTQWFSKVDPPINLYDRLELDTLESGRRFRFRLRANPCVCRNGKRIGLLQPEAQEDWLVRKGERHGFVLPRSSFDLSEQAPHRVAVHITQEQMLRGQQRSGNAIRIYSVLYDGVLMVNEPNAFRDALRTGIGHGKALGLGLLSVAPAA